MNIVELPWEHIRSGRIQNYPNPIPLNVNLAYTVMLPDKMTHLFWLPYEYTGLCYKDLGALVNVFPLYKGVILDDVEISHGTDLYKPKTEKELWRRLYQSAWDIEMAIEHRSDQFFEPASAADYLMKMHYFVDWLKYYSSSFQVSAR